MEATEHIGKVSKKVDMGITPQPKHFFDTFGYLVFPGLFKEKIGQSAFDHE